MNRDPQIALLEAQIAELSKQRGVLAGMTDADVMDVAGEGSGNGCAAKVFGGLLLAASLLLFFVFIPAAVVCLALGLLCLLLGNQREGNFAARAAAKRTQMLGNIDFKINDKHRQLDRLYRQANQNP